MREPSTSTYRSMNAMLSTVCVVPCLGRMSLQFVNNRVQVADCDLQYVEAGTGPSVVFLHGGGGFRFDEQTFTALAQRYCLLVPSMPGFDESTAGSTRTIEDV